VLHRIRDIDLTPIDSSLFQALIEKPAGRSDKRAIFMISGLLPTIMIETFGFATFRRSLTLRRPLEWRSDRDHSRGIFARHFGGRAMSVLWEQISQHLPLSWLSSLNAIRT
jgi:hypothetical protein